MTAHGKSPAISPAPDPAYDGRIVVVTGAASGIGQATAAHLHSLGAVVAGLDRIATGIPDGCHRLIADLRDAQATIEAMESFASPNQRLDVLVGNAGVSHVGTVEDGGEDDWHRVLDINLMGQVRSVRAALPWLRRSESPSIVMMSSCSACNGIPERALYSASKGAVQALAHAMATDLVGEGITVNCVSPGTVDTPFMAELIDRAPDPQAKRHAFESRQPTGRMVDPSEVAAAVAMLAHPQMRSTTGSTIVVDGGMGMIRPASE